MARHPARPEDDRFQWDLTTVIVLVLALVAVLVLTAELWLPHG